MACQCDGQKHEHIQAFLMYEITTLLQEIERRGIGFIDLTYKYGIDYKIDGTVYHIRIEENEKTDTGS